MEREGNSDPIPIDIILEILSRSSPKSIARFGIASKSCASILSSHDFTKLFKNRFSTSQPRLLFAIKNSDEWSLYSSPQLQNLDGNNSLVVSADFHMKLHGDMGPDVCSPVSSGLLYFPKVPVICNPSTGQYVRLPQLESKRESRNLLLGYDPIGKQYKALNLNNSRYGALDEEGYILTLGTENMSWRKLHCPLNHYAIGEGICIDGVLYYISRQTENVKIACFDVRHEQLRFLNTNSSIKDLLIYYHSPFKLINYKGKLGVIIWRSSRFRYYVGFRYELELWLWILEDSKKREWSKRKYTYWENIVSEGNVSVVGVTANGEIILSMDYTSQPFFVFYFNPERNTLERVRVKGFEALENPTRVYTFVDYAEDLKFITESS